MTKPKAVEPALVIEAIGVGAEGGVMGGDIGSYCVEHPADVMGSANIDAAIKEVKGRASFHTGINET